jgi:hypothetical protein
MYSCLTVLRLLMPLVINRTFSSAFHSYCTLLPQTCEEAQEQHFGSFLYVVCNVGISNLLIKTSVNGVTLYFASASFQNKVRRNSNTSVQAHGTSPWTGALSVRNTLCRPLQPCAVIRRKHARKLYVYTICFIHVLTATNIMKWDLKK